MRTNLEKFNHFKSIVEQREEEYAKSCFPQLPEKVYQVENSGEITEITIEKLGYNNHKHYYFNRKPTNQQVIEMQDFAEDPFEFVYDDIRIFYSYPAYGSTVSGSYNPSRFEAMSKTKEDAEILATEIKEAKLHEQHLLENGHFRCRYCSKITPNDKKETATIFGRGTNPTGKTVVTNEKLQFCSGQCAIHEQMSREG